VSGLFPHMPPGTETQLIEKTAEYFAILSDPSRLLILRQLCLHKDGLCVGQLVSTTNLSQPNVSRHLTRLHALGLVSRRRHKIQVYYSLSDPGIEELCGLVCKHVSKRSASLLG
jgi:DNA-binding transcriptional ArsR family regulator